MALDLKQSLKSLISKAVPGQAPIISRIEELADHLVDDLLMASPGHVFQLEATDLERFCSIWDARALVNGLKDFQKKEEREAQNDESSQRESSEERPRRPRVRRNNSSRGRDWDFEIDWSDVYKSDKGLRAKLTGGKKLKKKVKLEIVRRLVKQARSRVPGVQRSIFVQVAMDMKKKYPVTFSSELAKGKISKLSLCKRMQDHFDNVMRRKRKTTTEDEAPAIKPAFGCVRWRVLTLPQGETEANLIQIQVNLKDYFETRRPQAWDWKSVSESMDKTYGNQREDINKQAELIEKAKIERRKKKATEELETVLTTTEELRNKWPFLFHPKGMMEHFAKLTGIDINKLTHEYVRSREMKKMVKFLLSTNDQETKTLKNIKKRMKRSDLDELETSQAALIYLLLQRFKEDKDGMFLMIDENANEDDISTLVKIPNTPRLIVTGNHLFELKDKKIFFTMDGQVLGIASNLVQGFGLLFASYYVFNIVYEPTCQLTLEFIQRVIADINPCRGNKRPSREDAAEAGVKFSSYSIHPAVRRLDRKYDDFFPNDSSDSSSSEDTSDAENRGL